MKKQNNEDLKKKNGKPNRPQPSPIHLYTLGIVGMTIMLIFGKVIAATIVLSGAGWIAGKVVKRIEKKKENAKCYI